jgi:hypothetical protein
LSARINVLAGGQEPEVPDPAKCLFLLIRRD